LAHHQVQARGADHLVLRTQLALSLKSQANTHFSSSRYREALDLYTASLNKNPFDPIVWSNRAAVRLKLEEYGLGVADSCASSFRPFLQPEPQADLLLHAARAIELDSRAVKVRSRPLSLAGSGV